MRDDTTTEFVLMGRGSDEALSSIDVLAREFGVAGRVHYEGAFSAMRGDDGTISDPGWRRVVDYLGRARLAPDPWPMIGWSARFEAMMLGAPTVHLGVRTDSRSWGRPQPVIFDSPQLDVPMGTVSSAEDYGAMCRRLLSD